MDFTVDFIMNSLQISLVGIHREIHNEILFVLISHEIQQITQKLVDFMISHRISLKPIGFHINPPDFTKSGNFMMVQQDFTKSSGFHEIQQDVTATGFHMKSTNEIQPHVTEIHRISQYFS